MGITDFFAKPRWEPLCAIGSHQGSKANAQICISVLSASIVPEKPRLAVILWKSNYTHELVCGSGTFTVTLLTPDQVDLVDPLGLQSGRNGDKLAGLAVELTSAGDPYFCGAKGYLGCEVMRDVDLGDSTLFIAAVREDHELSEQTPVTWSEARDMLPAEVCERYDAKFERDIRWSSKRMLW